MSKTDFDIVLASGSPRRQALLAKAGIDHRVFSVAVDESLEPDELKDPEAAAKKLAERKARAALERLLTPDYQGYLMVIGADTMVVLDGKIFGKPADEAEAVAMLSALSGRTHRVITAVSVWVVRAGAGEDIDLGFRTFADSTAVRFRQLKTTEISAYVATGDSMDKAGAYGIQSSGCDFVEAFEGSKDTVMGLPLEPLLGLITSLRQALEA